MDSVTQAALGACIAGTVAGKHCNGKVLFAGALLGTLPDLDILIDYGDAVSNTIKHRGFSHSLLVLLPFSLLLAWLFSKRCNPATWPFKRLLVLISGVLLTHPLLDYFTTYGTQLTWPFDGYYSRASIFIIDPFYTLPLFVATLACLFKPINARRYGYPALFISCMYLGWGLVAKAHIEQRVTDNLNELNISSQQVFITPTPFNSLLWRIVVIDNDRYFEGMASLLDKHPNIRFERHARGAWPLNEVPSQLSQYQDFTHGFIAYQQTADKLIVSDLRMGITGNLAFEFEFAVKSENGQWLVSQPQRHQSMSFNFNLTKWYKRMLGDSQITSLLED